VTKIREEKAITEDVPLKLPLPIMMEETVKSNKAAEIHWINVLPR
jgi:hypothetical protein